MRLLKAVLFFVLALAGLLIFLPSGAVAESASLPASLEITRNSYTPAFPDNINFEFEAKAGGVNYTRLELSYRLAGEVATRFRSQDLKGNTGTVSTRIAIDTRKDFIPPGARIRYYWTLFDSSGKGYDTESKEFIFNDERFNFKELNDGLITVRWYEGTDAFGKAILNKARETVNKLSSLYNIKSDNPIIIHIYPNQTALYSALPTNTHESVGGQAYTEYGAISLMIPPGNTKEIGRSIPHEVSHQIVYRATLNPYNHPPLWLDEGLAVYNQDEVEAYLNESLLRGIDRRTLQPLRTISGRFPSDPTLFYQSYGESVSVVQYIVKKFGPGKLGELLNFFKNGVSHDEALQAVLNLNTDQLDYEWKTSLGYPAQPPVPITTAVPIVTTVAPVTTAPPAKTTPASNAVITAASDGSASTSPANFIGSVFSANNSSSQLAQPAATNAGQDGPVVWLLVAAGATGLAITLASGFLLLKRNRR
jgi:hypothetical protein